MRVAPEIHRFAVPERHTHSARLEAIGKKCKKRAAAKTRG